MIARKPADDCKRLHIGPVAHRQQGCMVLLTVRQFAVDQGRDERERGKRLPVGRGIISQVKSPVLSVRFSKSSYGYRHSFSHGTPSWFPSRERTPHDVR